MQRDLSPAIEADDGGAGWAVRLSRLNAEGRPVRLTEPELSEAYGTVVDRVEAAYTERRSRLARDGDAFVLHVPAAPVRDLAPAYSETVDQWLRAFGGEHYTDLQRWLSFAPDVSQPLAALYLEGERATGKTLFASAVSRLFSVAGPTRAAAAASRFNDDLLKSPLVFADEALPSEWAGKLGLERLREFIAARIRDVEIKYRPLLKLRGCVRLVIAANNRELIAPHAQLTTADSEAINSRIRHILVRPESRAFLESLPPERIAAFVDADEVARHALWLRDNLREPRRGPYGLAYQASSALGEAMQKAHPVNAAVAGWICRWLTNNRREVACVPSQFIMAAESRSTRGIVIRVNPRAMGEASSWDYYSDGVTKKPQDGRIVRALVELSGGKRTNPNGKPYYMVTVDALVPFAEDLGIDRAELEAAAAKAIAKSPAPVAVA